MRPLMRVVAAALLIANAGCSDRPEKWEETVWSPDGRTFVLTRYQEFTFGGGIGEPFDRRVLANYWLEFDYRRNYRVRWEQTAQHVGAVALLSTPDDRLYLLTMPLFSDREQGCPNPPYLLWRHAWGISRRSGVYDSWYRVPLEEIPYKLVEANMTFGADREKRGIYNFQKWKMDFSKVDRQSFGDRNCYSQRDYLLVKK